MGILRRLSFVTIGVVLATSGITAVATPASAVGGGSVVLSGNTIFFTGTAEDDTLIVGSGYETYCGSTPNCLYFFTRNGVITSNSGCQTNADFQVTCVTSQPAIVEIDLGTGNDRYISDPRWANSSHYSQVVVEGGEGNDTLEGGNPPETLDGGPGDDQIVPDQGVGVANVGPDLLSGGAGNDTLNYSQSPAQASGVRLSLNGTADDGTTQPRDVDNVASDFESMTLTSGPDAVVGDDRGTVFHTLAGNDHVDAEAGNDTVVGGDGDDTLTGGPGVDSIFGDAVDDTAIGNDTIFTADGEVDEIYCGGGADAVSADAGDRILDACESVTIPGAEPSAKITAAKPRLNATKRRKKASLALQCSGGLPCVGRAVVRTVKGKSRRIAGRKNIAVGAFNLAADSTKTVKLTLRKPARKILRQTRRAKVRVKFTLTDERSSTFTTLKLTR